MRIHMPSPLVLGMTIALVEREVERVFNKRNE